MSLALFLIYRPIFLFFYILDILKLVKVRKLEKHRLGMHDLSAFVYDYKSSIIIILLSSSSSLLLLSYFI